MEQKADENFQSNLICSFNEVTCWNLIQNPWGINLSSTIWWSKKQIFPINGVF